MASISAGNDEFVGNLIADAIEKVGPNGIVSIMSSSSSETFLVIEEGMKVINRLYSILAFIPCLVILM